MCFILLRLGNFVRVPQSDKSFIPRDLDTCNVSTVVRLPYGGLPPKLRASWTLPLGIEASSEALALLEGSHEEATTREFPSQISWLCSFTVRVPSTHSARPQNQARKPFSFRRCRSRWSYFATYVTLRWRFVGGLVAGS